MDRRRAAQNEIVGWTLLGALGSLLHVTKIEVGFHIHLRFQEPQILLDVNAALEGVDVRKHVWIAIKVLVGVHPPGKRRRWQLAHPLRDLQQLITVFRIHQVMERKHRVFHEIGHGRLILLQEAVARCPDDELGASDRILHREQVPTNRQ